MTSAVSGAFEVVRDGHPYRHVYVHVPFCARRCSYCDFAIAVRKQVPVETYVHAVDREVEVRGVFAADGGLDTLYLGGGTPSRLGGEGVMALLGRLQARFGVRAGAEVTLEANPEDITVASVAAWRSAGITRLSIGIQSFDENVLRWMHRVHDADGAHRAIAIARDGGLEAFSIDLIFALPDALSRNWDRDLEQVLHLAPDHVSLYGLTVEAQTPLGKWSARGDVIPTTDERYASEFLRAHERLQSAGYEHYEVSNFAKPGRRAVHNSAYWSGVPYLGLGPSAHGFDGNERRWNREAYAAWTAAVGDGQDPMAGAEQLTRANRDAERVYLGLRTSDGLAMTPEELAVAAPWFDAGWLEWTEGGASRRVRCTPNGWLLLDRLAGDLTAVPSHS